MPEIQEPKGKPGNILERKIYALIEGKPESHHDELDWLVTSHLISLRNQGRLKRGERILQADQPFEVHYGGDAPAFPFLARTSLGDGFVYINAEGRDQGKITAFCRDMRAQQKLGRINVIFV